MNLQEWLSYGIDRSEMHDGFVRCFTDESHGLYVDVYSDHAEDQDCGIFNSKEDIKYIENVLIPDFKRGFDGNINEFERRMSA